MKSLFEYHNYRKFLEDLVYSKDAKRGTQVRIAKAIGCQAAYLSQVLKGKAELTEDHALKLARFLNLPSLGVDYLVLIVRLSRASSPDLRKYLEQHREKILKEVEEASSRVQATKPTLSGAELQRYFSSWIPSTVHMATSSSNLQTPEALAQRLRLPLKKTQETLQFLHQMGLVTEHQGAWQFSGKSLHFPKESSINTAHQISRRHQAIRSIEQENSENIHFSSIFTISEPAFRKLKSDLLNYIEDSHKTISSSGADDIHAICLDLFRLA